MTSENLSQFIIHKNQLLGKGATGQVYLAKHLREKIDVAVKIIDLKTIDNEVTKYLLNMQKKALMSVINPYVLRGISIIQNNKFCYLITQLCNGGSLKAEIRSKGPLGEAKSLKYLIQILKGECGLIGKGIIHRDLKPANILLHNGQAKIIDFGYCQIKGQTKPNLQYNVGSPSYMSPQAFTYNQYSQKSQIWALGITFYQCLNGKTFDDGKNMSDVFKQIKKNGIPYRLSVSDKCKYLIQWCLQHDPKKRPNCLQLLNYIITEKSVTPNLSKKNINIVPINNYIQQRQLKEKKQLPKQKPQLVMMNDIINKEDILKNYEYSNKIKQSISTYQPKNFVIEKRKVIQNTPFQSVFTSKSKYQTQIANKGYVKPSIYKQPSFKSQAQNNPNLYYASRQTSRDKCYPFNIPLQKNNRQAQYAHKKSPSVNIDYFGYNTQRY